MIAPCPYCKADNRVDVDLTKVRGQELVWCDSEEANGCGRLYVAFWHTTLHIESKTIDGQQNLEERA